MALSAYDRKNYRESKRRRRQALRQSETGCIKPYRRGRGKMVFILCAAAALCAAIVAVCVLSPMFSPPRESAASGVAALSREERLRPVNKANPLDKTDVPALTEFHGVRVHSAIAPELEAMRTAAKKAGISLVMTRGYVSYDEQQKLYEENLAPFLKNPNYTPVRAQAAAQRIVPEAGCCEAQTGLTVEFDLADPRAKAFVERECIRYGFIQRFAENKEEITHMQYSETVYRYVGKEDAEKMRAFDMCLEEYADYAESQLAVTWI